MGPYTPKHKPRHMHACTALRGHAYPHAFYQSNLMGGREHDLTGKQRINAEQGAPFLYPPPPPLLSQSLLICLSHVLLLSSFVPFLRSLVSCFLERQQNNICTQFADRLVKRNLQANGLGDNTWIILYIFHGITNKSCVITMGRW